MRIASPTIFAHNIFQQMKKKKNEFPVINNSTKKKY